MAAEALGHPWLHELHSLNMEPTATPFDFSFEGASDLELRQLLDEELRRFHPQAPLEPPNTPPTAAEVEQQDADITDPDGPGEGNAVGGAARKARAAGAGRAALGAKASAAERGGVGKRRR